MITEWIVPYVNYKIVYKDMGEEIIEAIRRVMEKGDLILRQDVEEFEENFARFLGVKYAIGVNSCTDAMRLSLRAVNTGEGDEVITSSHTFLATLDAIVDAGAWPVLVDSDSDYNIDAKKIESEITTQTKAIIPVHLNGRVCDMDTVMDVAERYNLLVIEDTAQAIGASFKGQMAGTFGLAGAFSFFPAKVLGTIGDGGMVVSNDKELADKIRAMREYGRVKGQEQVIGYGHNSRLDNIHAAILNVKLQYLPQWIVRRREIAVKYYDNLFGCKGIISPNAPSTPDRFHDEYCDVFQNYVIRAERRDALIKHLADNSIECLVHWRTPLHKQFRLGLGHYKLPITEAICDEVVSLPMYPELTDEQVEYVCEKIRGFYQ